MAASGSAGTAGTLGRGIGGGLNLDPNGSATIRDTVITGNHASTSSNDVSGTFTS
jgi:hypothetical protein